jgi:hypothetical protein
VSVQRTAARTRKRQRSKPTSTPVMRQRPQKTAVRSAARVVATIAASSRFAIPSSDVSSALAMRSALRPRRIACMVHVLAVDRAPMLPVGKAAECQIVRATKARAGRRITSATPRVRKRPKMEMKRAARAEQRVTFCQAHVLAARPMQLAAVECARPSSIDASSA